MEKGTTMRNCKSIICHFDKNGCLISVPLTIVRDKKCWRLSRYVFFLNNGYLPEVVMHTCDNPSCINPQHLIAGTVKENALDMVRKGRQPSGNMGKRKLTEEQVRDIKRLIPKLSLQKIADKYNISKKMVIYIKQGKKWRYINEKN